MDTAKNPCPVCHSHRKSLEDRCESCGWSPAPTSSPTDPKNAPSEEPADEQLLRSMLIRAAVVAVAAAAAYAAWTGDALRLVSRIGDVLCFGGLFLLFVIILWILRALTR